MAASHISGPSIVAPIDYSLESGPSVTYQGDCILDVRTPYKPGVTGPGRIFSFLDSPYNVFVDAVPSAAGAAKIAASQAATSGVVMTLAVASTGIAPNAPIIPFGMAAANVVRVLAIEPGFVVAATTAGSAVITIATPALFPRVQPGLNLAVAAGAGSTWQLVTVLAVSGAAVTVSAPMGATLAAAPVVLANGTRRNDEPVVAITAYQTAGAAAIYDPRSGLTRGTSVTSNNAADTGWTVAIRGWDVYMQPMTELLTVAANATSYGRKPMKYIGSITPIKAGGGTTTGTLSIGTSDLFGFALRSDAWEYMNAYWAGNFLSISTGWTAADTTTPATATTGAVRGTLQVSAIGPSASFAAGGAADGTKRLGIYMTIPSDNLFYATTANPAPLFGPAQFAG